MDPATRKQEFERLNAAGVKGVKINFFRSDKQWTMKCYLDILKDAAADHLLVDFHGCTIARGWQRTYSTNTISPAPGPFCNEFPSPGTAPNTRSARREACRVG